MSEKRPVKRQRVDDAQGFRNSELVNNKSGDFWLPDGNIVLTCESMAFRVHQSVLAMHSPIFKDMLTVGSPGDDEFDDCAAVTLPDTAQDILHMLKALYFRDFPDEDALDLPVLASLLRMATKYMIGSLRKEVLSLLKIVFPDTLDAYSSAERSDRTWSETLDPEIGVELGITCNAPIIIPTALYMCALQMFMANKSSMLSPTDDTTLPSQPAKIRCLRFMNNWADLMDCIFSDMEDEAMWKRLEGENWKCLATQGSKACDGFPHKVKRGMETRCRRLEVDVLEPLVILTPEILEGCSACKSCTKGMQTCQRQLRRKIWEILPVVCGYTSWDALRFEQDAVDA